MQPAGKTDSRYIRGIRYMKKRRSLESILKVLNAGGTAEKKIRPEYSKCVPGLFNKISGTVRGVVKYSSRFSVIQLFGLFKTSVRAERTSVRAERTDVTRSCRQRIQRKIELYFAATLWEGEKYDGICWKASKQRNSGIAQILEGSYEGEKVRINGAVHNISVIWAEVAFVILRKAEGLVQCVYEEGSHKF